MKIIVDDKIPYLKGVIEQLAEEVVYLEGKAFTPEVVRDADALLIRTRTRCNRALLEGSRVRFIATATIGFDHIDTAYCAEAGITWTNAPGCNAASVAQYLHSVLLLMERDRHLKLQGATLGVVGVGHVGTKVAEVGRRLGMRVLLCDPPRAEQGETGFLPLEQLQEECDVLTFHTPLIREGAYPTYHLVDADFLKGCRRTPYLINTSRGEVVDNVALLEALQKGLLQQAVIDVWENEPNILPELLKTVWIGTPHIAGYSADGKANATRMSLDALCRFFGIQGNYTILPPALPEPMPLFHNEMEHQLWAYNPYGDSHRLKENPALFEQLRGNYPLRREL
jgi:erythronate-4-phosphate dehydrogenase